MNALVSKATCEQQAKAIWYKNTDLKMFPNEDPPLLVGVILQLINF